MLPSLTMRAGEDSGRRDLSAQTWLRLMQRPLTIDVPEMVMSGIHPNEDLATGSGVFELVDGEDIKYRMTGMPSDIGRLLRRLRQIDKDIYDEGNFFRVVGSTIDGVDLTGAGTAPSTDTLPDGRWTFEGEAEGGLWVNGESFGDETPNTTEIAIHVQPGTPLDECLHRFGGMHRVVDVLGEEVLFQYSRDHEVLRVTVGASGRFPFPWAENWLAEPLRIMFGQLIYPRITARNHSDGSAHVSLRQNPEFLKTTAWIALWSGGGDETRFWALYADLLAHVVESHVATGNETMDGAKLTRLYEEVVLATRGSRWVWAMVIASSVENLLGELMPADRTNTAVDHAAIEAMSGHIRAWNGDRGLIGTAINALERRRQLTARNILATLKKSGVITKDEFDAWEGLRHSSMHGNPVSRYGSHEADGEMLSLGSLLRKVTLEVIRPGRSPLVIDRTPPENTARTRIIALAEKHDVKPFQYVLDRTTLPLDETEALLAALADAQAITASEALRLHIEYIEQRYKSR